MPKSKRKERCDWDHTFNSWEELVRWEYFVEKHSCDKPRNPYYFKADPWMETDYIEAPTWFTEHIRPYIPYMTTHGLYICRNGFIFSRFEGLKYTIEHFECLAFHPSKEDIPVGKYDLKEAGPNMGIEPPEDINDLSYWAGKRSWMSKQTDSPTLWRFWPHTKDRGTILYALPFLQINSYTYPFNTYSPFVVSYYFLVKEKNEEGLKKFMERVEITRK